MFNCEATSFDKFKLLTFLKYSVCCEFKYIVYINNNNITILMNIDVIKNLLNGLIINNSIKKIDIDEQVHTLLVVSVKVVKLKCSFEFIYIL
jgi:hypothetical protein